MSSNLIAVVAGVGPGTGAAVARKFAQTYPVVLFARSPENYQSLVEEIKKDGGHAVGISTDVASFTSVTESFSKIEQEFGHGFGMAAAVFNASSRYTKKPFLELTPEEFYAGVEVSAKGAFHFAKATLPHLLQAVKLNSQHPPSLIFTGATASIRGSAQMSSFASGKFALRALSQSLAREYGPRGVHVSHAIIDGIIDIPRTKGLLEGHEAKISADAIADAYWYLHTQPRTMFTWEIDIRPAVEKW